MLRFTYTVTPLPPVWPGPRVGAVKSKFKTQWTRTLDLLDREIRHLNGTHVEFACDIRGERDINLNGQLRANARPGPRVIVSFRVPSGKRLQFPCGTYTWWQDNVYAIAKSLENLRAVERWGVSSVSQYEGFRQLPAATGPTMTAKAAADTVASYHAAHSGDEVLASMSAARDAVRAAIFWTHPDKNGGDRTRFDPVETAKRVLSTHHGVSL